MPIIDSDNIGYISWHDLSRWESTILLGNPAQYYNFQASWNSRDNGWYITITTLDNIVLIAGRKLILRMNLFSNVRKGNLPNCILLADTDDPNIQSITYDNMANEEIKLFHITA